MNRHCGSLGTPVLDYAYRDVWEPMAGVLRWTFGGREATDPCGSDGRLRTGCQPRGNTVL